MLWQTCATHVVSPLLLLLVLRIFHQAFLAKRSSFFTTLPKIGVKKQWLAWSRATLSSPRWTQEWAFEGYRKHCKSGHPFIMPSVERGPIVIIPPQQIRKVYGLPESSIDMFHTSNETIQTKWTIWDQKVYVNNFQMNVIRNQLTRNLDKLTPVLAKELHYAFEKWWGNTKEWKEVYVWDTCLDLVAGASNSMFVGHPLCRNVDFLHSIRDHGMTMFAGAMVVSSTPGLLKPISGLLVAAACRVRLWRTMRFCLPVVKQRLHDTAQLKADPSYDWTPPEDGLQWLIDEAYATKDPTELDLNRITHRLIFINDISLHSTAFTAQNFILELFSTNPSLGYVETLREECAAVFKEFGGAWTRDAVKKLKLVDSALRESIRLQPVNIIGLPRTVIARDGITLDDTGVHIPRGTVLQIPTEPIHYDEDFYPDPWRYNPWRFVQPGAVRSIVDTFEPGDKRVNGEEKPKSSATLDDSFLGFGFGKHACPGRFFALNEVKLLIAHMLLNFDIDYLEARPKPVNICSFKFPWHGGKIRVRSRT